MTVLKQPQILKMIQNQKMNMGKRNLTRRVRKKPPMTMRNQYKIPSPHHLNQIMVVHHQLNQEGKLLYTSNIEIVIFSAINLKCELVQKGQCFDNLILLSNVLTKLALIFDLSVYNYSNKRLKNNNKNNCVSCCV